MNFLQSQLSEFALSNVVRLPGGLLPYAGVTQLITGEVGVGNYQGHGVMVTVMGGDGTTVVELAMEADLDDGRGFLPFMQLPWWTLTGGQQGTAGAAHFQEPSFALAEKLRWRALHTAGLAPTAYLVTPIILFRLAGRQ
jgi:hypothetical protein